MKKDITSRDYWQTLAYAGMPYEEKIEALRATLTAALAAQPGDSDNDL